MQANKGINRREFLKQLAATGASLYSEPFSNEAWDPHISAEWLGDTKTIPAPSDYIEISLGSKPHYIRVYNGND